MMADPNPSEALRAWLNSVAYGVLARLHRADAPGETLVTFAAQGRYAVRIVVGPSGAGESPSGPVNMVTPPTFAPMELDILRVMTSAPQTTQRLARRAGRTASSHFRQALADLCRKGIIVRTPDGYRWA